MAAPGPSLGLQVWRRKPSSHNCARNAVGRRAEYGTLCAYRGARWLGGFRKLGSPPPFGAANYGISEPAFGFYENIRWRYDRISIVPFHLQ